jgi:hypothetical protein
MAILDIEPTEHELQAAFFEWWEFYAPSRGIAVELCFAVPNGGHRHPAVAGKLKAEGVRAGVCDVFLLVPRGGFHALILEFKRQKGRPSEAQERFLFEVRGQGYNALIVRSTDEAIRVVTAYLAAR